MDRYGIVYMGSKEKILNLIDYIFEREQEKEYIIDLFTGGFAVSGYALMTTKYKVIANDLNPDMINLYREIFAGGKEFDKKKNVWVNRKLFNDIRDYPQEYPSWYVGFVLNNYSFGCNQKDYLYAADLEENKHAIHEAIVNNDYTLLNAIPLFNGFYEHFIKHHYIANALYAPNNGKRVVFMERLKSFINTFENKDIIKHKELLRCEQIEHLTHAEHVDGLKQYIKHNERLFLYNQDWKSCYNNLPKNILDKAVIYCDPPYQDTKQYRVGKGFDYPDFWDWFRNCPVSVYVSSYSSPPDIKPLNFEMKKQLLDNGKRFDNTKTKKTVSENLYWNGKGKVSNTLLDMLFGK